MHLFLLSRGIKQDVEAFFTSLSEMIVPFKLRAKDGKVSPDGDLVDGAAKIAVRPIQLHEIVFPKESKDVVLTTLFGKPGTEFSGKTNHPKHQKYVNWLRKVLGIKPIPENWDSSNRFLIKAPAAEMVCVGMKDDKEEWGMEQL